MTGNYAITRLILCITTASLAAISCDQKPQAAVQAAPAPAAAAANPWDAFPATNRRESFELLFRLARLADVWHGGKSPTITLRFESPRSVTDDAGHSADVAPGQWKGMLAEIANAKGTAATRALPAGNHNYADGLGKAKCHAYTVVTNPDGSVTLTTVKPLDTESNG